MTQLIKDILIKMWQNKIFQFRARQEMDEALFTGCNKIQGCRFYLDRIKKYGEAIKRIKEIKL